MMSEILSFGEWVRRRRRALDLTQDELAARAGCSKELVAKIEGDARRPSKQVAALLAGALELAPDEHEPFVRAARAELAPDRLPAPLASVPRPALLAAAVGDTRSASGASAAPRRSAMPSPVTHLIGRERESAELLALVARPDVRLVTLTGAGGSGKTRLALGVAAEASGRLGDSFADGIHFVDLSPVADHALVAASIAHALELADIPDVQPADRLRQALRARRVLLVLDNFEHVLDAAPPLGALLRDCPGVTLLVTSRVPLHLAGEREYPVAPLAEADAARLFAERAQAVRPDFALTDANRTPVAALCRRLDGLPLAIELAASRTKLFTPEQLLARIEASGALPLLTGGPRDLPSRQQTIRAAIDWSYQLLSSHEQRLCRRLGVFVGGFTEAAAVAVGELDAAEAVEMLAALVDHSLVRVGAAAQSDEPRFTLLETIREYMLGRLAEAGEEEATRERHAAHYVAFAEAAEPHLRAPEQITWLNRAEADLDNIRAAIGSMLSAGTADGASRLTTGLAAFWDLRDHLHEGMAWMSRVDHHRARLSPAVRAHHLRHYGWICWRADETGAGSRALLEPLADEAIALYQQLGDRLGEARTHVDRARLLTAGTPEEVERADAILQTSLEILRGAGDEEGSAWALHWLSYLRRRQDRQAEQYELLLQSLELRRRVGDRQGIGWALVTLGALMVDRGDYAAAHALNLERLTIEQELRHSEGIAVTYNTLGNIASHNARYDDARVFYERAEAVFAAGALDIPAAYAMVSQAVMALEAGAYDVAHQLAAESVSRMQEVGQLRDRIEVAGLAAHCWLQSGDVERADALITRAEHEAESVADTNLLVNLRFWRAWVWFCQGRSAEARSFFERDLESMRRQGEPVMIADTLIMLGRTLASLGDLGAAVRTLAESVALLRAMNHRKFSCRALEALATCLAVTSQPALFVRVAGAAAAVREQIRTPMPRVELPAYEQHVDAARAALGDKAFDAAWQAGRALTWEQAADEALAWLGTLSGAAKLQP